jgi:hypothetical protein
MRSARRASAASGLIDLEVKALVNMAYPLSLDRRQEVARCRGPSAVQHPATRSAPKARTRKLSRAALWAGGWNARDAEDCRQAVEEIRRSGDRKLVAAHLIGLELHPVGLFRVPRRSSGRVESLAVLVDQNVDNPYLSFAYWLSQFTLPWSLLFSGSG